MYELIIPKSKPVETLHTLLVTIRAFLILYLFVANKISTSFIRYYLWVSF